MSDRVNTLNIREYTLDSMPKNPAIVIVAKRGSGKTWVCRSLLEHLHDYPVGIIISHTERIDPFFGDFFPDTFIYNKYDAIIFKKILARQVYIKEKAEAKRKEGKTIDTRLFLMMDDCLSGNKEWGKDENLKEILFNGRHYDITYILTMQAPLAITPELRSNFDLVMLLDTDVRKEQEKYNENYTGIFPNFNAFKRVYDKLTADHGVMVVVKRGTNGSDITNKIYHYKAHESHPSMLGCKQFIRYHKKNYDKEWRKKLLANMLQFDINDLVKQRNTQQFKVDVNGR